VNKIAKINRNKKAAIGPEIDDDTFDDMDGKRRSKIPALVMWYLPVIDRLKRLFSNPGRLSLCAGMLKVASRITNRFDTLLMHHSGKLLIICILSLPKKS
jgi:hypothetical protein